MHFFDIVNISLIDVSENTLLPIKCNLNSPRIPITLNFESGSNSTLLRLLQIRNAFDMKLKCFRCKKLKGFLLNAEKRSIKNIERKTLY